MTEGESSFRVQLSFFLQIFCT